MVCGFHSCRIAGFLAIAVGLTAGAAADAAPRITNVSLRGLQAGGVTTLVIEGSELLPEPRIYLSAPVARQTIKEGATPQRLEVEFLLDGQTPAGIYLLRVASATGISEAVALGVDNLPQITFTPQTPRASVAMSGALAGSTVLSTTLAGKKDQRLVVEVESQRLGAKLDPVIHVYDARGAQLAWSQALPALAGDARTAVTLPADGEYRIELHDALYRGGEPGFFRLKIGEFHYADLVYPLAVERGANATFEFAATDLPADARATATWSSIDGLPRRMLPAPWPAAVPLVSGSRPRVLVTDHAEIVEAAATDKPQEISAAPVAINGRIAKPGEHDRYRLAVTPGAVAAI